MLSSPGTRARLLALALAAALAPALSSCGSSVADPGPPRRILRAERADPFLDEVARRTFLFFWETTNPANGLVRDRWPTPSFSSVAAIGFGLTAYPIGAERGWVTREQARERVLVTLRFLQSAPQGPAPAGMTGHRGFFYHFLDMETGARWGTDVELSTIDTTLLLGGVLFCREYFDRDEPAEAEVRDLADRLYARVEWDWARPRPPLVSMGWTPEAGFHTYDWRGYDEAMLLYILALGSPTHPLEPEAWARWTETYRWGEWYGTGPHVGFAPLFGHQFSHVWVDFRGIADAYMRERGIDYFENSRRATLAQRAYAADNPGGFAGYSADVWGLSACDGPADATAEVGGRPVRFLTYAARGASFTEVRDDGTITPMAAASSIPFAPEVAIPALKAMHARWGERIFSTYGFLDAFNPTFPSTGLAPTMGHTAGDVWVDGDYLGIDQGPLLAMLENERSGLVWRFMRRSPYVREGLRRAGFTGGWLEREGAPARQEALAWR